MKSLTCDICGTHIETGATEDEVMGKMWTHMQADHKEMADKMSAMPQEEQDKMMAEAKMKIKDM